MPDQPPAESNGDRDLTFTRLIDASPDTLFRCWTDPTLLVQWFTLSTWKAAEANLDVRPGGRSTVLMRNPEGQQFPNCDVYLDVVPNRKLVLTDAFSGAWEPSDKAFMVVTLTFESVDGQTQYTVRVAHWSAADKQSHEQMGFHQNWAESTDRLAALASTL